MTPLARSSAAVRRLRDRLGDLIATRRSLLRQLMRAEGRSVVGLTMVMALTAAVPVASSILAGLIVGRASEQASTGDLDAGSFAGLLVAVGVVFVVFQALASLIPSVNELVARQIDGSIRSETRELLSRPRRIAHLELASVRNAESVVVEGLGGLTIGQGATGQVWLLARMLSAVLATLVIARVAPLAALLGLIGMITQRAYVRRQYLQFIKAAVDAVPDQRGSQYWAEVGGGPAGAKEVRVFGLDQWVADRQESLALAARRPLWAKLDETLPKQWNVLGLALATAVLTVGGITARAFGGGVPEGALAAALTAVVALAGIANMGVESFAIEAAVPGLRALEFLRSAGGSGGPVPSSEARSPGPPRICFEDLHFRYPGAAASVFSGLDLEIAPGERVAIVGANGAGKTTLVRLLGGFYRPSRGRVLLDGVSLEDIDAASWWRQLAIVFQDFSRLELPVAANVALRSLGRTVDADALDQAARVAGIHDIVEDLPEGWDSTLSRRYAAGSELSGGQWQRVALARGVYACRLDASVLILDEPTAHLDVEAETALCDRIFDETELRTTIVISHRFSSVRRADRIIVLADGAVTEDGTHEELLARGGAYASMFALQARSFELGLDVDEEPVS